jgi:hypothetical protein
MKALRPRRIPHERGELQRFLGECEAESPVAVEILGAHIEEFEKRMESVFEETEDIELLRTLPSVGFTLAVVIAMEVEVRRRVIRTMKAWMSVCEPPHGTVPISSSAAS